MNKILHSFEVRGLFNSQNYKINFDDDKVILIGVNGSGKTTLFKLIYFTLICDWSSLINMPFESLRVSFGNGHAVEIERRLLEDIVELSESDRIFLPLRVRALKNIHSESSMNQLLNLLTLSVRYSGGKIKDNTLRSLIGKRTFIEMLKNDSIKELLKATKTILSNFKYKILYLPTYRRIEEPLNLIFPDVNFLSREDLRQKIIENSALELIQFGMEDVEKVIELYLKNVMDISRALQNEMTLKYFSEILNEDYEKITLQDLEIIKSEMVKRILNRIKGSFFPEVEAKVIFQVVREFIERGGEIDDVRGKIITHYLIKLIKLDTRLRSQEKPIDDFVSVSNRFLISNKLDYDSSNLEFNVWNVEGAFLNKRKVGLQDLSSGEKQLVSVFAHLTLVPDEKFFVFIDEPELSLSVEWQKIFLPSIEDCQSCCGLIATTHSPFIFDNELERYVHEINEYRVKA